MKQIVTSAILTLLQLSIYSQELILKKQYYANSKQVESVYHVLKSDTLIKHGEIKIYKKIAEEDYKNFIGAEKERLIKVNGQYTNGQKTGNWRIYLESNIVFNFDSNELIKPKITVKYPLLALEFEVEGDVIIKYNIEENCKIGAMKFSGDENLVKGAKQAYKKLEDTYQLISEEIGNCVKEEKVDTIKYRL